MMAVTSMRYVLAPSQFVADARSTASSDGHSSNDASERTLLGTMSAKVGLTRETLRRWVRRANVDRGLRSGVATFERGRIRKRENRELRRPRRS
jgi:hypothetical protein